MEKSGSNSILKGPSPGSLRKESEELPVKLGKIGWYSLVLRVPRLFHGSHMEKSGSNFILNRHSPGSLGKESGERPVKQGESGTDSLRISPATSPVLVSQ